MNSSNLSGRAGRWAAGHWKTAFFGWLVFAAAAIVIGTLAGHHGIKDSQAVSGESAKAKRILEQADYKLPATESVLVQSQTLMKDSSRFHAVVDQVLAAVRQQPDVSQETGSIQNPYTDQGGALFSSDKHSALVQFDIKGKAEDAQDKVEPILDAVATVQKKNPGFVVEEFGSASAQKAVSDTLTEDFHKAEYLTLPITLAVLLLAFGALVAALLPVLLGFSAVLASIGLFALITFIYAGDFSTTQSVILLIGMAVGVDYSLFYLRREREERHAGRSPREALLRTAATSGQAVLVSGATVMVAMAGMFIAGNRIFTSIGIGTMLVVLCAVVGSVTVLAALLSKLGDRVDRGRVPIIGRRKHAAGESRAWSYVLDRVLRRPVIAGGLAAAALVALAIPAFWMHTRLTNFTDLPHSLKAIATYDRIQKAFPGSQSPAVVVVKADNVTTPAYRQAFTDFLTRVAKTKVTNDEGKQIQLLFPLSTPDINPSNTVARVDIWTAGNGYDKTSIRALDTLRHDLIPDVAKRLPDATFAVTGDTADTVDFNSQMKSRAPYVFVFVLGLAFLLLLMTFRSIVIPIKSIILNLLSVGAAYGILVLVFQHTWAEGILGFTSNFSITSWLPLFLFVVLFGLSMDYHVFILSRVKELVDRGMTTEEAVSKGIRQTAGTVTSAAIVMVAVFGVFATLREIDFKQTGVGLAVAVLVDATIVRAVLLPASMKLLGEWNWYLPRWLEWLPSLSAEGAPEGVEEAPTLTSPSGTEIPVTKP